VGFIVLVGLACKNAILIVEFAKKRREFGASRAEATLDACELRLRPIMMTSFAFILGVVPLMLSTGAGAEMRQTLGTAVFSGMLGVTLFGIFLTPVFYFVIQWASDRRTQAIEQNQPREVTPAVSRGQGVHSSSSGNGHHPSDHGGNGFDSNGNGDGKTREHEDPVTTEV
jgi:predicted RND superfamily exporter protein